MSQERGEELSDLIWNENSICQYIFSMLLLFLCLLVISNTIRTQQWSVVTCSACVITCAVPITLQLMIPPSLFSSFCLSRLFSQGTLTFKAPFFVSFVGNLPQPLGWFSVICHCVAPVHCQHLLWLHAFWPTSATLLFSILSAEVKCVCVYTHAIFLPALMKVWWLHLMLFNYSCCWFVREKPVTLRRLRWGECQTPQGLVLTAASENNRERDRERERETERERLNRKRQTNQIQLPLSESLHQLPSYREVVCLGDHNGKTK